MILIQGKSQTYGGREQYLIPIESVVGKQGELKTVEVHASEGFPMYIDEYAAEKTKAAMSGKPLLFRGNRLLAFDSDSGNATIIVDFQIGGRSQYPKGMPTHQLHNLYISRGTSFDAIHPKQPAVFTIQFLKDATWGGQLHGYAIEVEGAVYEIAPPATPCTRDLRNERFPLGKEPFNVLDFSDSWRIRTSGRKHCDRCWHFYEDHASWPWRAREQSLAIEVVEPGKHADLILEAPKSLIATEVKLDRDLHAKYDSSAANWVTGYRSSMLYGGGFAILGKNGEAPFTKEGTFDYREDAVVPANHEFVFRVLNGTADRRPFRGKLTQYELHV